MITPLPAESAAYLKIRSGCAFRSLEPSRYSRVHQCFHPGLPHMAECCQILCPVLVIQQSAEEVLPCELCLGAGDVPAVGKYGGTYVMCDSCDGTGKRRTATPASDFKL